MEPSSVSNMIIMETGGLVTDPQNPGLKKKIKVCLIYASHLWGLEARQFPRAPWTANLVYLADYKPMEYPV